MLEQTSETVGIPRRLRVSESKGSKGSGLARVHGAPVALWLGLTVVSATALRFVFAWRSPAPWIVPDEPVYSQLARSFAEGGHFSVAGHPFPAWSFGPLYPMVVAPTYWVFGSLTHAYLAVKALNCLLLALSAIPAYFLARRVLDRANALILACLAVLIPSGIYTTKVMTESLSYPLFLLAALAVVTVLERPSRRGEVIALIATVAAALSRAQLAVLLPAFLSTAVVVDAFERREAGGRGVRRYVIRQFRAYPITWLALASLLTAFVLLRILGISINGIAHGHGPATASVGLIPVAQSFILHLATLDLYVGVLPFAALAVLTGMAAKRGMPRETRILCAFTISVSCWLALAAAKYLVAAYPGSFLRIYDRYMFYAVPLLLIAFLVWLREGLPRPRGTVAITLCAVALPIAIPYSHVLSGGEWGVSSSSVALVPWANLRFLVGTPLVVYPVLLGGAAFLANAFIRSKDKEWLLFLVVANFVVVGMFALWGNSAVTHQALNEGVGQGRNPSWIDSAVGAGGQVDVLWTGTRRSKAGARYAIWESEFFNRSVKHFYWLHEPLYRGYPGDRLIVSGGAFYRTDGQRFRTQYVLANAGVALTGRRVAADLPAGLSLYKVYGPLSLR
jgi:hypothetical protein